MRTTSALTTLRWQWPTCRRCRRGQTGSLGCRCHTRRSPTDAGYHLNVRAPNDIAIELFVIKSDFANTVLGADLERAAAGTHQ